MFTVLYHPKVREDFRKVHKRHVSVIKEVINTKIAVEPEIYGKPLRRTLKSLRSLRVGSYRIVYTIKKQKLIVLILTVANRDKVYKQAEKRSKDVTA